MFPGSTGTEVAGFGSTPTCPISFQSFSNEQRVQFCAGDDVDCKTLLSLLHGMVGYDLNCFERIHLNL